MALCADLFYKKKIDGNFYLHICVVYAFENDLLVSIGVNLINFNLYYGSLGFGILLIS